MKLGLDIHGTLDDDPEFFLDIVMKLKRPNQVHIVSGSPFTPEIVKQLKSYNNDCDEKWWDYYFSVVDYLLALNVPYKIDEKGHYWFDDKEWTKTKGIYCAYHKIDLMVDDMQEYGEHFSTDFINYKTDKDKILTKINKWV